jgi:hypothetical protein
MLQLRDNGKRKRKQQNSRGKQQNDNGKRK